MALYEDAAELAAALSGQPDDETLLALCQAAEALLRAQLRDDLPERVCTEVLPLAAALLALSLRGAENAVERMTVGDFTVETAGGRDLREQAMLLLRPWLRERDFGFQGVRMA